MGYISPTLAVRNMKKTIQFYKNSLGFKMGMTFPDADNPEYADLSKDGMILMFILAENIGIGSEEKLGVGVNIYMQIDGYKLTFNQAGELGEYTKAESER